jgi:putative SOS response-associated peptidase YedK
MCGRFALSAKTEDIEKLIPKIKVQGVIPDNYNIAPSQNIASILSCNKEEISYPRWGLIPNWSKEKSNQFNLINARSDTLASKPIFKSLLLKKRCLILASGYYEWKITNNSKSKQPYYIKLKDTDVFAFAGIWDKWISPDNEDIISTTIITCEANKELQHIHNRMPVIMNRELIDLWLDESFNNIKDLSDMLNPYQEEYMEFYPVSNYVNSPKNNDIRCVENLLKK